MFFVAGGSELNKAHVQYLEAQLIGRARAATRLPLDNANSPAEPGLSEPDRAFVSVFLDHMLGLLPVLGIHAFETITASSASAAPAELVCKGKGVIARGYESTQGFVVKAGSEAVGQEVPSMKEHLRGNYDLRQDLKKNGVLKPQGDHFVFSQDYPFSSPSTAAEIVMGCSANGRTQWKDSKGRTLKELQEKQASAS